MSENEAGKIPLDLNRREFIKGASFGSIMLMMGGTLLQAEEAAKVQPKDTGYSTVGAPVSIALIGCGIWGREVLQTLALLPNAPVVAICDTYKAWLNRAKEFAPKAEAFDDYQKVLALKNVEAVIVATPTHLHKEIVLAALKAGKHVYCEVPTAHTPEDARAIAQAAKVATKLNFQAGLQMRADPGKLFVRDFIRSGATGAAMMARAQWHLKDSWRRTSPNPEREKALNWRLDKTTSLGLIGEIGIHQLDLTSWFINEIPVSVTGFGGILSWDDGRDVPDTAQAVVQFPSKINLTYDCTLASSFDGTYDMLYGKFASIMMRDGKAWLFKEADSPLLGWEIYASKQDFYKETGISLSAGASHSVKAGAKGDESPYADSTLNHALKAFVRNCAVTSKVVADFASAYGDDAEGVETAIAAMATSRLPAPGFKEGFAATVLAIKANEAVMKGSRIDLDKEMFAI